MLGNFYNSGSALHGVQLDHKEAVRLYRLAADQGEVGAIYSLGFAYYRGAGVPQDYKEAARLFRIAADQGYATAQSMLGSMYSDGYGVPKDKKEAIRFYGLAVDQGDKNAQFGLAQTYCEPGCIYGYTGRTKMKNGVVAYALFNHLCALKSTDDITCTMRDKVEIGLSRSEVDAGQALTRDLAQGKPTQVIARYLKTGSASK